MQSACKVMPACYVGTYVHDCIIESNMRGGKQECRCNTKNDFHNIEMTNHLIIIAMIIQY